MSPEFRTMSTAKPAKTIRALEPEPRIDAGKNTVNPERRSGSKLSPVMPYRGTQKGPIPK